MKKDWNGLVTILEIQHISSDGKIIWEEKNIKNMVHASGEQYMLKTCFQNDGSFPPSNYYFGLDNRSELSLSDTLDTLVDEPVGNGYFRAAISSNGFNVELIDDIYRATGPVLTFSASGSGWGPVNNIFLATSIDNSGFLVSSNQLSSPATVTSGYINLRVSISLADIT